MNLRDLEQAGLDTGLHPFTSEFYTEHYVVKARLLCPERRLSDHLNGAVGTVDVRPLSAVHVDTEVETPLGRSFAQLNKGRILFVVPVSEPDRPTNGSNAAWKVTAKYEAWAGIGRYSIDGTIHTDAGRDPQIALRLLGAQFLPITGPTITFPNGEARNFPTVIINRQHLDILALKGVE